MELCIKRVGNLSGLFIIKSQELKYLKLPFWPIYYAIETMRKYNQPKASLIFL